MWASKMTILPVIIVIGVLIPVSVLLLDSSLSFCPGCPPPLFLKGISIGSNGTATFSLGNARNVAVTITVAKVYATNTQAWISVFPTANNVIHAAGSLDLTVQFPSTAWQSGMKYYFDLTDSMGDRVYDQLCFNSTQC